jgi:protein PhnA
MVFDQHDGIVFAKREPVNYRTPVTLGDTKTMAYDPLQKTSRKHMTDSPACPKCRSAFSYEDRGLWICPECSHEWSPAATEAGEEKRVWRDANGTELKDGDTVTVIKDLKVKGSPDVVKVGTKVKGIRLVEGDHDIDCKIPGIGAMGLKTEFVRKVTE